MTKDIKFEIMLVGTPGLEPELLAEAKYLKFSNPRQIIGGVTIEGGWADVWRANLQIRGSSRVLIRIGSFHVGHLAQLDKLAHAFAWKKYLRHDVAVSVEAVCKKSKIYHSGAAAQRIETAIKDVVGTSIDKDAPLAIKARIEKDLCTISIDTSGEMLHKRGHKEAVAKAPLRETLASLMLRRCGFDGHESVLDPMCGSGTFVIEAAEIANQLMPGRSRNFAFEELKSFEPSVWEQLKSFNPQQDSPLKFHGSDRDAGAVKAAIANAKRAGVQASTSFSQKPISELIRPIGPPGLVMVNPPYGLRIGDKKPLFALYETLGQVLQKRFTGWRVGLVTADTSLAKATKLPFAAIEKPILHGGLSVYLFHTQPLA
jgi:putative N6-adenine-specific DNA methylase